MSNYLDTTPKDFMSWSWSQIEPYFLELDKRKISAENVTDWLADWSRLTGLIYETYQRLYVAITADTTDLEAKKRYDNYLDQIFPEAEAAEQRLKQKLLASDCEIKGFEIQLRNMRAEAALFKEENIPLLAEELRLKAEYDKITGAQTVDWEGQEATMYKLQAIYLELERGRRESAWRAASKRQLGDRQAIDELWVKLMAVRGRLAKNAGMPDYRAYRWQQLLRFDYTPEQCSQFAQAIKEAAVPAASYLLRKRSQTLGLSSLRPWDTYVNLGGQKPLHPFKRVSELEEGVARIFRQIDPELANYFSIMQQEGLLDLENRKGKAPGGYCTDYPVSGRAFIFMNAVGVHEDVLTLLHEGGHAFHFFECDSLPYLQQKRIGIEFMEVASTTMELLAAPYLPKERGGFYTQAEARRAQIDHLDSAIRFWPYMAVVDAFQHWVYQNHRAASDPANCDAKWAELWGQFMPDEDWSGLEDELVSGWQRKLHIIQDPFYYIEYGLALLGAFQIWHNALADQKGALTAYRRALSMGGTVSLPELYAQAGARLAFDAQTLQEAIDLGIKTIQALECEAADKPGD